MAHIRGIHETRAVQSVRAESPTAQRGKLMAKLARMDHQRGLLERQLAVWTGKQQVTKERLTLLQNQMEQISRLLRMLDKPSRAAARRRRGRAAAAAGQASAIGAAAARRNDMSLEY